MKKILLTGFEPFQGEAINPSRQLALMYEREGKVATQILPVSYHRAWETLLPRLQQENFDFILMLGQAGGRRSISLERTAINMQDTEKPDEDQDLRLQKKISLEGPDAFLSPLPLRDWARELQSHKWPVEVSFSAGAFVCNSLYYQAFEYCKSMGLSTHVLFVHVPYVQEQMLGQPEGTPFVPLTTMKSTIDELLKLIEKMDS